MDLNFQTGIAGGYTSIPQTIRVLSEAWVHEQVLCPSCGRTRLDRAANNRRATDFHCFGCAETYELKSKNGAFGPRVVDGAYETMMARLQDSDNPNLLLLTYKNTTMSVVDLSIVPKHFFTTNMIEPRKPLAPSARRAGWVGCQIRLDEIPATGRIFIIQRGIVRPQTEIRAMWQRTLFLREEPASARGWLLAVMSLIERLGRREFSIGDAYAWESELRSLYPHNQNVRPKIRQQLQVLRDRKYLLFVGRGLYRVAN